MAGLTLGLAVALFAALVAVAWLVREVRALRILLDEAWEREQDGE